jgi:hypothetical protein
MSDKEGSCVGFFAPIQLPCAVALSGFITTSSYVQGETIGQIGVVSMLGDTFHGLEIANGGLRGAHYDADV